MHKAVPRDDRDRSSNHRPVTGNEQHVCRQRTHERVYPRTLERFADAHDSFSVARHASILSLPQRGTKSTSIQASHLRLLCLFVAKLHPTAAVNKAPAPTSNPTSTFDNAA